MGDKLFKKENSYPMDFPDFYPEKAAHNCHYCGKGFSYKKGLRRHLRQMHEPVSIKSEMDEDPDWQIGGEFLLKFNLTSFFETKNLSTRSRLEVSLETCNRHRDIMAMYSV